MVPVAAPVPAQQGLYAGPDAATATEYRAE